jgi:hypothetical protein
MVLDAGLRLQENQVLGASGEARVSPSGNESSPAAPEFQRLATGVTCPGPAEDGQEERVTCRGRESVEGSVGAGSRHGRELTGSRKAILECYSAARR